jgi:hypothetical protein
VSLRIKPGDIIAQAPQRLPDIVLDSNLCSLLTMNLAQIPISL